MNFLAPAHERLNKDDKLKGNSMGVLLEVVLPLSLAFIMFSLGVSLTLADFARVVKTPLAVTLGGVAQIILLPVIAFILLMIFPLPPELALGVMILSFCPGGVTSNILTRLSGGTLALSITLTAVFSLLAVITVPLLVAWSAGYFMGVEAPEVDVTALGIAMFLITAVPVGIGVALRHFAPETAIGIDAWAAKVATGLFIIIVIGALASNWGVFVDNIGVVGPVLIVLNVVMLAVGFFLAKMAGLDHSDSVAISLEAGVQNATLGITVGGLIAGVAEGIPALAMPSGVYGITMYFVTLPFIFLVRRSRS
ncbi:MAG: bile acid:sodium symporter family protein [Pseudomonadota bacterium]